MAAETFQFTPRGQKPIELNGQLMSYTDSVKIRLASHEYLKKDGADQESMGAAPMKFTFKCVYLGDLVSIKYQTLVRAIRRQPRGRITHPRLGGIDVACEDISGSEDAGQARDTLEFTLSFVEDSTQTTISITAQPSVQRKATDMVDKATALTAAYASIVKNRVGEAVLAAESAVFTIQALADGFGQDAIEAAQTGVYDASLANQAGRIVTQSNTVAARFRDLGLTDAAIYPATSLSREIAADALDLAAAVDAQFAPIVPFVVPAPMSLADVAVRLYGRDARNYMTQLRQLNPYLATPYLLSAGTTLKVLAPEIRQ